jgi:hypothetical protein
MARRCLRSIAPALWIAAVAGLSPGCGGSDPGGAPKPAGPGGSAAEREAAADTKPAGSGAAGKPGEKAAAVGPLTPAPPPLRLEPPPRPTVAISVNGSLKVDAFRGTPLIVQLGISHPRLHQNEPKVEPMVVSGPGGTAWSDAIRLEVVDENGQVQKWPLRLLEPGKGALTLDAGNSGRLVWQLSPEEAGAIADGQYRIVAMLDTTGSSDGWKGRSRSTPAFVRAAPEPAAPTAAQDAEKFLRRAQYELLNGRPAEAANRVDELPARHPKSIAGLEAKGDLSAAAGKADQALRFYNLAIEMINATSPKPAEPPQMLLRKRNAQINAVLKVGEANRNAEHSAGDDAAVCVGHDRSNPAEQRALGESVGSTRTSASNVRAGKRSPSPNSLSNPAAFVGVQGSEVHR